MQKPPLPATPSGGHPTCLTHPLPVGLPRPWFCQRGLSFPLVPIPRPLLLKLELARACCQGLFGGSQPPLAQLGPLWKDPPAWAAADLSLPCRPRVAPGLGAREGPAGAGPGYLQEESFGFGSPLLGPIQLTLPLPAAEKRQRLKRAPSWAPLRAALPGSPASPRGAPAEPQPRRPCQLPKLTSARRLQ